MEAFFEFLLAGMSSANFKWFLGLSAVGFAVLAYLLWGQF